MGINVNIFKKFDGYKTMRLGTLYAGGIILSYKCTNSCRHCLVMGSPCRENKWLTSAELDDIYKTLKRMGPDVEMHIGGGEGFLNPDRLVESVELAVKNGVTISYVETNGFWGRNPQKYVPVLRELKMAGLKTILISVSPFHAEFISPETTIEAIRHVREVFGYEGAFVWVPEFLEMFSGFDKKRPIKLENYSREILDAISDTYYLVPGGRAGYIKPELFSYRPAQDYFMTNCERELLGTGHFHIDCYGNYMPGGLCAGIAPCGYRQIGFDIDLDDKPILRSLLNEGVRGLFGYASSLGYGQLPGGYAGKCHLCVDIRKFLFKTASYSELLPAEFYKF